MPASQEMKIEPMQISDESARRMLDRLDEQVDQRPSSRRRSERVALRGKAIVVLVEEGGSTKAYRVMLRDVSRHGVGFLCTAILTRQTTMQLMLPLGANGAVVKKRGIVAHCRKINDVVCAIGVEFGDQLPEIQQEESPDEAPSEEKSADDS